MMLLLLISVLAACLLLRLFAGKQEEKTKEGTADGLAQTTGNKEIQSDAARICITTAGKLAVLADGIGKENTGKVCANLAAEDFVQAFSFYKTLHNPEYFFERTIYRIHRQMQKILGEYQGGASLGVVLLTGGRLHYAMAGQVKIVLIRNRELIPLVEGQTVGVLACQAYQEGRLSRQETIWSMEDHSLWNYVGKDGFRSMEIGEMPIVLKKGDMVAMITKGVFEEMSYAELEAILNQSSIPAQEKAERVIKRIDARPGTDKDNGSILVLSTDGAMK